MSNSTTVPAARIPPQVRNALYLIGIVFVLGIVLLGVAVRNWPRPELALALLACRVGVCALWIYGLYHRQNWLRWLTIVIFIIGLLAMPWSLPRLHELWRLALTAVELAMAAIAVVLLCLPESRDWFKGRAIP